MQTFLPYSDFSMSAKTLDMKRLGKQRVEVSQILQCLRGEKLGWRHHPAVKMWKGYESALALYGMYICYEWIARGYRDTLYEKFVQLYREYPSWKMPEWLGNAEFHRSHQSNLIRKDPEHYGRFGWNVDGSLPYVWPTKTKTNT